MKKTGLILLFFATFLSARGQGTLMDLPYFPSRTTKHMSRCSIEYAADGVVQHAKRESFGKHHEGVSEYHLYSHKVHPRFGLMECVYVIDWGKEYIDTLRYLCEYDSAGRMLHEYCDDEGSGYRDRNLF